MGRLLLIFIALYSIGTWAQEKSAEKAPVEITGRIFMNFQQDTTNNPTDPTAPDSHRNKRGFDVDRSYLQASYKFDESWSSVLLLDVTRNTRVAGNNIETSFIYLRNAYIQFSESFLAGKSRFRFGMQPSFYVSSLDSFSGLRWLFKTMADEVFGSQGFASQTAGVSYLFTPHEKVDVGIMVHNGYENIASKGNTDNGLAGDLFINLKLHESKEDFLRKAGVILFNGYFQQNDNTTSNEEIRYESLAVYLATENLSLVADMINSKKKTADVPAKGYGFTVSATKDKHGLFGRYYTGNENFRANLTSGTKTYKNIYTYGYFYKIIPGKIQTAVMLDNSTSDNTLINADKQVAYWKWELQF